MFDKEKKDLRVELKARKIVQKKLNTATAALYKKILKIRAEREKRIAELSEYHDERDLQDAYGWGIITEEEYDRRLAALRDGRDKIDAEVSAEEIAWDILSGWSRITKGDIDSLEFELLPPAKQEEIRQLNYEIAQKREERRKKHDQIHDPDHGTEREEGRQAPGDVRGCQDDDRLRRTESERAAR